MTVPAAGAETLARTRARLAAEGRPVTAEAVVAALRGEAGVAAEEDLLAAVRRLRQESVGLGPLDVLLRDPTVTDVLVNRPDEVWVDRGGGLCRAAVAFADEAAVRRLAQRLLTLAGRRLDDAAPYADGTLPGGLRVHAVLPPVSPSGTCLSVRVPARRPFTFAALVDAGCLPPAGAPLLAGLIRARVAFLVTGGTGTGKTTLLASMLGLVDPAERVLLVEDTAELSPAHPHVVRLQARPANAEGAGAVPLSVLVRQALRMRPDRIVVGEVRGAEIVDLLAALNTGHEGGCGTLHANRVADVPARLEALGVAAGLGRQAVHSQAAAALQAVVHLRRRGERREVAEVAVLSRGPDGLVTAVPAVRFEEGRVLDGPAADVFAEMLGSDGAARRSAGDDGRQP